MTVTLGPFFFSSAVEGPGNSRKKTEPTTRAAAKSTFMFLSERRSIHREQLARAAEGRGKAGARQWVRRRHHQARARGEPVSLQASWKEQGLLSPLWVGAG